MCLPKLRIIGCAATTVFVLFFGTVLCHPHETLAATGNELVSSSSSNNAANINMQIWQYFLRKYSASKSVLTYNEVDDIISRNCFRNFTISDHAVDDSKCEITTNGFTDNVTGLHAVCNYILYRIDNPNCCNLGLTRSGDEASQDGTGQTDSSRRKPTSSEAWGFGVLFVTVISLSSLVGVSLMPLMDKAFYKHLLTLLIGLAVGSLTGSSLFHLLPQAFGLVDSDKHHRYLLISLFACGGIWMFFMVERLLKFIKDYKDRKEERKHHEQSLDGLPVPCSETFLEQLDNGDITKKDMEGSRSSSGSIKCTLQPPPGVIYESQAPAIKASFGHQQKPRPSSGHDHIVKFEQGKDSVIAAVAWMIIFGDGLHNFIDGISIGAAFNESILTGVSISLAVLCEELPHELGDFAVLLNAGMSMKQAVLYNFLSACTCYVGLGFGILLGEMEGSAYIFALAGGMFLYIALVDMVPEMNEIAEEKSKVSVTDGLKVLLLQNFGLFSGITILFILAKFQDDIKFD